MAVGYYLDSCIWLNLFKKRGDSSKGIPYWEIALDFIENVEDQKEEIYVSTIVLKELLHILRNKFEIVMSYFKQTDFIKIIKTKNEDYVLARKYETEDNSYLSFYDYLHVVIARRLKCDFVTRDKDLINFAKDKIKTNKPEELIS